MRVPKWSIVRKGYPRSRALMFMETSKTRVFFGEVCSSSFTDSDLVGRDTSLPRSLGEPGWWSGLPDSYMYNGNKWRPSDFVLAGAEGTAAR